MIGQKLPISMFELCSDDRGYHRGQHGGDDHIELFCGQNSTENRRLYDSLKHASTAAVELPTYVA